MSAHLLVSDLVKTFGGLTATNNMSFAVERGESVGLIGPNGAGKTTVFSLIMGEHRQNSGSISFDGTELTPMPTHQRINRGISRTYQVPRPFADMDVRGNIRVGLMPNSIWHMLTKGPDPDKELELALSVGFAESDLDKLPSELSMGDLRKLELARTLATDPEMILLDEVFAGLTIGEIAQITELLHEKRQQGMSMVIVSHDLRSLQPLIDRAVAITYGSVVAEGKYDDVIATEAVRSAYLGL
ncbi:ATP-binding cassette domain-containing protein [Alphaproteobacteria bacterium]|jgi:branched-chain amino acid transport system ATP-binding protein|nr:ATP-binding cassette domain-containing protein [Alphaproteobacteria bacterium]